MSNTALASTNQARKKGTRYGEVYADKLPEIDDLDIAGINILIQGGTAVEAFKAAHPNTQATDATIYVAASKWRNKREIRDWIAAAQQSHLAKINETLDDHVKRLQSLASAARRSGNYGAAAQAEIAIGRVLGHYVERTELTIRRGRSSDSVLSSIEALLGPEAARIAAKRLGIQYNQSLMPVEVIPCQSIPVINQDQV